MNILKKMFNIEEIDNSILYNRHIKITFLGFNFSFKKNLKSKNKTQKLKKCIGIFCGGGIGDYILLRNNIKYLKEVLKEYNIVYFAKNCLLNELAENYDNKFIDKIISISNIKLSYLNKNFEFDTIINFAPFYNIRKKYKGDINTYKLIKSIQAKNKIANIIDNTNNACINHKILKIYTNIIHTPIGIFEDMRIKLILENAFGIKIPFVDKNLKPIWDITKKYILLSPFSRSEERNISCDIWVNIVNYISEHFANINIVFIGNEYHSENIELIINKCSNKKNIVNLAGKTDITLLPSIIKGSLFLIAPDTGTIHIANATQTKGICISGGSYYCRFQPYEKNITYIYPEEFEQMLLKNDKEELKKFYNNNYTFNVKNISFEKIKNCIEKIKREVLC